MRPCYRRRVNIATPVDVATRHTADFLEQHVESGATLLEVGCGDGHVAAKLIRRGIAVTGIDADPESVAHARSLGVPAIRAEWPAYPADSLHEDGPFAAVAFTRSLHHIFPLTDAVTCAERLLRPGGTLLLEDFAYDEVEPAALEWFAGVLRATRDAAM